MMKRSMIIVLFVSFFATTSDCISLHSRRNKEWRFWSRGELNNVCSKNNNSADRQKNFQFNERIHQPRKHNHGVRCSSRRNQ